MNTKRSLVATALAIAMFVPAGSALAAGESNAAESGSTSTTVPARQSQAKGLREQLRAWQDSTREWVKDRRSAMKAHREALASASADLKDSLAAATTKEQRKSAMQAFAAARTTAKSQLEAALSAIGERPQRPRR